MADDFAPIRSTGIGSWPGSDLVDALKISFDESPDLPFLPELPDRGVGSRMVGRGIAVLSGLAADLQPAGWRLTDAPGRDQLRARARLRDDCDQLEEVAQDYTGPFKIAIVGPWTLAASVERPRGDRLLADHGARRDLVQSLGEGIADLIGDLRRRLPRLDLVLQVDEPALPAVLAGEIPTASGFSHHRKIDIPEVSDGLTVIVASATAAFQSAALQSAALESAADAATRRPDEGFSDPSPEGARVWLHSCAQNVPVALVAKAGFGGLLLDLDQLTTADWDAVGQAMTDGLWLGAGALPTSGPVDGRWSPDTVAQRVLRAVRTLGLEPDVAGRMVITPACGLARFDQGSAVRALRAVRKAADIVTDQLAH
ncbi:hypothetical protein [Microlunatus sp. Gsoil 973]|uniref:hypothetical protein n=1 Tax=Microlunatus sp. Gsoil 973 TaxID=2672569 RepID=UPI0012B4D780|nr:hypothetical protein [Microlunatus sp. Gsoil 973]QGN32362.1 hypothetical protein GJV80_05660 [Microlunatus sp. Gsoil 973]